MRKTFILFSTSAAKRLTFKQRSKFINYIGGELLKNNIECSADKYSNRIDKEMSLVVGNLKTAKKIIVAGYDTPRKILFSKFIYHPLDWEKNRKQEKKNIIIVLIISIVATIICGLGIYYLKYVTKNIRLILYALIVIVMILVVKLNKGYANFYNFNKNTGGITVLFKLAQYVNVSSRKTAYVFLDNTAEGYKGYERLKELLDEFNNKNPQLIILDCIAEGENIYVAFNEKKELNNSTLIKSLSNYFDLKILKLNDEEYNKSPLSLYSNGIMIFRGKESNGEYIVENTRTKEDSQCDIDKLNNIYLALSDFIKK